MKRTFLPVIALLVLVYAMLAHAQRGGGPLTMPPAPGSLPAHRFDKIAEGVYYATATGSTTIGSNSVVIVNDEDVMVVDPGITPAAATAFIADVKTLTPKPIKYVVDTHYHYDHAFGNQVFGPDVTIIGHDATRRRLTGPGSLKERTYLTNGTAANRQSLHATEAADLGRERSAGARRPRAAARDSSAVRGRAGEDPSDAAECLVFHRHDAATRQPRDSDSVLRPRPH
jgi:hypothetical protein